MPAIAGPGNVPVPRYPTISGPIGAGPSSPTGGITTVKPIIDIASPRTMIPTLTPRAPTPTPPPSATCDTGCNGGVSGPTAPAVPGPVTGQPIPAGGSGVTGTGGAGAGEGADAGCSCSGSMEALEKFFKDMPAWALLLIGAAAGVLVFRAR